MLSKLLKHEFRATARVMLPLYIVLMATSVYARISYSILNKGTDRLSQWLSGLGMVVFVICVIGVTIMSVIMMISRFYKNLMTDEGYLTLSLPVTTHEIIFSKIITSMVWFIATAIADIAALLIVFTNNTFYIKLMEFVKEAFGVVVNLPMEEFTHLMFYGIELLFCVIFAMTSVCLIIYASISIGHSAANHKVLLSFVVYFAINFALQVLGITLLIAVTGPTWEIWFFSGLSEYGIIHALLCTVIAVELILSAVFYFITNIMLKNHLNLG